MKTLVGFDTETRLISFDEGPRSIFPPLICIQLAVEGESQVYAKAEGTMDDAIDFLLDNPDIEVVGHNVIFDLMCVAQHNPEKNIPRIYRELDRGKFYDTLLREQLIDLGDHGSIGFHRPVRALDEGQVGKVKQYNLAALLKYHLGIDISSLKDEDDSWRTNYEMLEDRRLKDWPAEALMYAKDDALYPLGLFDNQEKRRFRINRDLAKVGINNVFTKKPADVLTQEKKKIRLSFSMANMTVRGIPVDAERLAIIKKDAEESITPKELPLIYKYGFIRPAVPAMPYKNDSRDHHPDCDKKKVGGKFICNCPVKMKKPIKETQNKKAVQDYIKKLTETDERFKLKYTDKGKEFAEAYPDEPIPDKYISFDSDWMKDHAALDPTLEQLQVRNKTQKLLTAFIPALMVDEENGIASPTVHPTFNPLVNTGRTSSRKNKNYPSMNGQQQDPRIRPAMVPRPGYWFYSIDYSSMELGTLAQTCIDMCGYSVLGDNINAGINAHSYLGSQLAYNLSPTFKDMCTSSDPKKIYKLFNEQFKDNNEDRWPGEPVPIKDKEGRDYVSFGDFFQHWRKFAKPVGLGYPGGLGGDTFITFAAGTYGVVVSKKEADHFKELWLNTYPEMVDYFSKINKYFRDPRNQRLNKRSGNMENSFWVITRDGLLRSGCNYCPACNGWGLQMPSASGATEAQYLISREAACDKNSPLHEKVFPLNFIHDEVFGEVVADPKQATEAMDRMIKIMVEEMEKMTPDVKADAEAALMERWSKEAKELRDVAGYLIPYEWKEAA